MPPKVKKDEVALDPLATALLSILGGQETLTIDNNEMAPIFKLKDGKNVGRKLNTMVEPYGYKFEHGKFCLDNGATEAGGNDTTTKDAATDTAVTNHDESNKTILKSPTKPRSPRKKVDTKTKQSKASPTKKRKFESADDGADVTEEETVESGAVVVDNGNDLVAPGAGVNADE